MYAGIPLSILFLWLALRNVNFDHVAQAFANARVYFLVPMLTSLFCFYWLKAIRWRTILSPRHQIPISGLVPSMMAGAAGNNLLPAHLGEFVRVYFSANQHRIPKSTVLASLVVERLLDVLAILIIFSIAIFVGGYSFGMVAVGSALLFVVVLVACTCALIVLYTDQCVHFLRTTLTKPSLALRERIADQVINLANGLSALREKNLYLQAISNSLVQWLLMSFCIYCAFLALNIDVSFLLAIIVLGLLVVGLALPTVPGFFGTMEYCFVLGLTTAGIDPSVALSAAIFYHIPAWVTVTITGLVLAHLNRFSFSQAKSEVTR